MWFKKRNETRINSEEYESVAKKLIELSTRLEELHNKFKILETNYDNLRGNFNRKLAGIRKEEKPEESENNLKPSVFLNPNGLPI